MVENSLAIIEGHSISNLFPLMSEQEIKALAEDIQKNGLKNPIVLLDGKILDGRNRYQACLKINLKPTTITYQGKDPLKDIVSWNLHRRHLNESQKAFVALEIEKYLAIEAKERQRGGRGGVLLREKIPEAKKGKASDKAAQIVGVNPHYITDAKMISKKAPEEAEKIKAGKITIVQVKRKIKEKNREKRRQENQKLIDKRPITQDIAKSDAKFSTIVIDPPWDWGDEGDQDQLGRGRPIYQTMPFDDLLKLPIPKLSDIDCHIYLWITNRSLPKGFELLAAWGFRYVTCLTWCKPSIGMGNYFRGSTEQVLFGVKGSQPLMRKDVGTWFSAPRNNDNQHSSKPDEFYSLIETCSPGPRVDIFGRKERRGWTIWGAEHSNQ
jgi:N6-adenosine-specific RNA methylase IME4